MRIAVSAYSGDPPAGLIDAARRFVGLLAEKCGDPQLFVGGYRGLMRIVVDEALRKGLRTAVIIPLEYEEDDFPQDLIVVSTGMSFKGRNVVLVRSGDMLAAMGGGAGSLMEIFAAYGMARRIHLLVGWGLPTDALREAYPDGRIGNGPQLISFHEDPAGMVEGICGQPL